MAARAPLRGKLTTIPAIVAALVVAALAAYFPWRELADLDREQLARAAIYGRLLANEVELELARGAPDAARSALAGLAHDPDVVAVELTVHGARVFQLGAPQAWDTSAAHGPAVFEGDDRLAAVVPLSRGQLVVELSNAQLSAERSRLAIVAFLAGGLALGLGVFFTYRLHADRAHLHHTVAELTAAEEQLARTNRELEQRVAERTTALSDANRQLKLEMKNRFAMEIELRQAQKLESVGRLASGIAHEINTPVQFVADSCSFLDSSSKDLLEAIRRLRAVLEALAGGQLDAAAVPGHMRAIDRELELDFAAEQIPLAIDRSLQGLGRVTEIVRAMKEFAYPDRVEQAAADLNRAITSTLTVAHIEYKYLATVETDFVDLPLVTCHVGELNQVLLNIVVNAAHAIEARQLPELGKITVRTRVRGDRVQIQIEDNGCGIPDAVIDKIFDPFFTTKEIGKGTGQGLAIARAVIVDKHHGKLDVTSQVGHGTTFTITLPIAGISHARGTTKSTALTLPSLHG
ncbi:MAG TPA: ATP-binding protein [Kofleriaceae bacterium]|nr:ATP-binding protein [Kofleriaceae bacterium]